MVSVVFRTDRFRDRLSRAGVVLLAVPTLVLFGFGVLGAVLYGRAAVAGLLLLAVTIGIGVGIRHEWWFLLGVTESDAAISEEGVPIAASIAGGTLLTLAGVAELGLSPVVSAAVVGIAAAVVVPTRAVPAYCGAFVGMTSPVLFATYWHAVLASVVATIVYLVVRPAFQGIGGKLGTTAFVGTTVTVVATSGAFQSDLLPAFDVLVAVVALSVVGAVATFALHTRLDTSSVFASGVVGAVGGGLLPPLYASGELAAAAVFSASFAGMADPKRIPDERWIGAVGAVVGVAVVYTTPYLGGSGGKLGTIAFGSCLAVHGLRRAVDVVRIRRRADEFPDRDTT